MGLVQFAIPLLLLNILIKAMKILELPSSLHPTYAQILAT
jgi:hypothetical protein